MDSQCANRSVNTIYWRLSDLSVDSNKDQCDCLEGNQALLHNRAVWGGGGDKVGWDELGALVHELVEGMLAIHAQCAPNNWLWKEGISWDLNLGRSTRALIWSGSWCIGCFWWQIYPWITCLPSMLHKWMKLFSAWLGFKALWDVLDGNNQQIYGDTGCKEGKWDSEKLFHVN